ncbi:hypothetical protein [Bradyrhizobium sp. 27S5]
MRAKATARQRGAPEENEHERSQREREWTFAPPGDGIFNLL